MKYADKMDKAQEFTCMALERMDQEGLAPKPDNFELWYCYYAQSNPDLVKAVDRAEKIDEEVCQSIFQTFLSTEKKQESIERAGEQVKAEIDSIVKMLSDVRLATSNYSDSLEDVSGRMEKVESITDLQDIVSEIVADTKNMVGQNKKLQDQLESSSSQVEELQQELVSIRKEAMTDGLTGLCNRKNFDEVLVREMKNAKEEKYPMTLLLADIDHFKAFNDNYGHNIGDQVLKLVAKALTDGVKGRDTAARYGGEEFGIVLPNTPLKAGMIVAEALRKAVEGKKVVNRTTGESLGKITLSVGVAEWNGIESPEDLIERSDAALYTAKNNGRNQVAAAS